MTEGAVCPACGREIAGNPSLCPLPCLQPRPQAGWPAPVPAPPVGQPPARPEPEPRPQSATIRCPNPACMAEVAAGRDECLYCGTRVGGDVAWVLEIAGHPLTIAENATVVIGRGDESPLGRALAFRDNISRRHCELRVRGGLQVRDLGSTNGTFVEDRLVGTDWEDVPEGRRLRLASDIHVQVIRRLGG